jgi:cell division protein FtsL
MGDECYIEPSFAVPEKKIKSPTPSIFQKYKVVIISFAVIIILLIVIMVWIFMKTPEVKPEPQRTETKTPPKIETPPQKIETPPQKIETPTSPAKVTGKEITHEDIIKTVDDSELEQYMGDEESD